MRKIGKLLLRLMLFASASGFAVGSWQEVGLNSPMPAGGFGLINDAGQVVNEQGGALTDAAGRFLVPNCAFGPEKGGPFRFFYQPGDPSLWVIFHSGGGACWENNTCGSAILSMEDSSIRSTYYPEILDTTDSLNQAKGIFDTTNPDNPYATASKVYIPYCTGDIGWGNNDATYDYPNNPKLLPGTYVLHHRGYANIRAVTEWLKRHFETEPAPSRVLVAGTSAGGYASIGVLLPEIARLLDLRHAEVSVIGDSANGVVTNNFLTVAGQSWGFDGTLANYVQKILAGGANGLSARLYLKSIGQYPSVRFSQYQNAFDLVQTEFFNIMRNVNKPWLWTDPDTLNSTLAMWTAQMRLNTALTAVSPAYRFYTAAGYEHGVFQSVTADMGLGFCSDDFATEVSGKSLGRSVPLSAWAADMFDFTGRLWSTGDWRNATCFPNCNEPSVCGAL